MYILHFLIFIFLNIQVFLRFINYKTYFALFDDAKIMKLDLSFIKLINI